MLCFNKFWFVFFSFISFDCFVVSSLWRHFSMPQKHLNICPILILFFFICTLYSFVFQLDIFFSQAFIFYYYDILFVVCGDFFFYSFSLEVSNDAISQLELFVYLFICRWIEWRKRKVSQKNWWRFISVCQNEKK